MTESRLEMWGLACMLLVCVFVGSPVLLAHLGGQDVTAGPAWLWWACYVGYLALLVLTLMTVGAAPRSAPLPLAALALCGVAVVLLAPRAGWTSILLVITIAVAAHVTTRRNTGILLAANSGVVALAATLSGAQPHEAALNALIYGLLQGCSVWAVWSQLRESAAREHLAVANTELRAATALLAESSRASERLRIARELHDLVGHQLTALVLELEVAAHRGDPDTRDQVTHARGMAKDLLDNVRTAVGELRGRPPELRQALAEITADLPRPQVHLTVDDTVEPDEDRVATLIRCVQEIVANAIRHSGAKNLWIDVGRGVSGEITLSAHDDGRGAPLLRLGNGLTGIRERIEQLGGAVSFDSRSGFRVNAEVPAA